MPLLRRSAGPDPQSFDHLAALYERRDELTGGWVTDWLEEQLQPRSGLSAIDLGCGVGRTAVMLAKHFGRVEAIDISGDMITIARERRPHPRIQYRQADLMDVRGQFDLVLSVMVLHHVPDLERTLSHIASLVRPGGTAILVDNAEAPLSRWQLHRAHLRSLYGEIRSHQPGAWERFRVRSNRAWVAHRLSDRYLTASEFESTYRSAFPGAAVLPVHELRAAVWIRPGAWGDCPGSANPIRAEYEATGPSHLERERAADCQSNDATGARRTGPEQPRCGP